MNGEETQKPGSQEKFWLFQTANRSAGLKRIKNTFRSAAVLDWSAARLLRLRDEKATKIENFLIARRAGRSRAHAARCSERLQRWNRKSPSPSPPRGQAVCRADQKDVKLVYKMYAKYIWEGAYGLPGPGCARGMRGGCSLRVQSPCPPPPLP